MTYVLEPLVAGELGDGTQLDATTHPPLVRHVEFVLDLPTDEDLIESFPVFLVSESLGHALASANLTGFGSSMPTCGRAPSTWPFTAPCRTSATGGYGPSAGPTHPTAGLTSDTDSASRIGCTPFSPSTGSTAAP